PRHGSPSCSDRERRLRFHGSRGRPGQGGSVLGAPNLHHHRRRVRSPGSATHGIPGGAEGPLLPYFGEGSRGNVEQHDGRLRCTPCRLDGQASQGQPGHVFLGHRQRADRGLELAPYRPSDARLHARVSAGRPRRPHNRRSLQVRTIYVRGGSQLSV
ncbi:unnamed protein product, partial [Ascophyllum nodosum]